MKFQSLSRIKLLKSCVFSVFLLTLLTLSLTVVWQAGHAQQARLSLADILIGLRSKKVVLEERNKLLADAVRTRGITFSLTPEIEKEMEETGADKELVEVIRQKSEEIKAALMPPVAAPTPLDFAFYQKRADAHMVKGEYDLAVLDYTKVIELNPKDASSYISRGLSYYNKKSYDLAVSDYNRGIELSPNESIAYFNRGVSYEKLGNGSKALADYQKSVELNATNETAKSALKRLQDEQAKADRAKAEQAIIEQAKAEQAKAEQTKAEQQLKTFSQTRPPETVQPAAESPKNLPQIINLGQLKIERATKMVMPVYSPDAKRFKIEGQVTVQVNLDEEGNITSAKAVSGPGMLRAAAEDAARKSKFKPELIEDKAVKSTGFIVYNFKAN
ncbi:MAG: TonB family protein [Pyrinomonadaceae bacterium]